MAIQRKNGPKKNGKKVTQKKSGKIIVKKKGKKRIEWQRIPHAGRS